MILTYTKIMIRHEEFYLLPQKAVYRPVQKQLIIADIHLGKASHFRKKGIAMPVQSHLRDIDKLQFLLNKWAPETVIILGDLFHSEYNNEWLWFKSLLRENPTVQFILLQGNHDILPRGTYKIPNLLHIGLLEEQHYLFSHHPLSDIPKLNICGHVHPGVKVSGIAKQSVTLPCFYITESHFIVPAFGDLTGLKLMEITEDAMFYLVTENSVVLL
jgi:uncharacterized protein